MKAVAKLKNCPLSARKMRMVVDLVRGKSVEDAINILRYNKREGSEWTEKVLLSAVANWSNKGDMAYNPDDYKLYVSEIFSDEGTFLKRFRPAPHGRAHRIRKRTNHLTVVVENKVPIKELDNSNS